MNFVDIFFLNVKRKNIYNKELKMYKKSCNV